MSFLWHACAQQTRLSSLIMFPIAIRQNNLTHIRPKITLPKPIWISDFWSGVWFRRGSGSGVSGRSCRSWKLCLLLISLANWDTIADWFDWHDEPITFQHNDLIDFWLALNCQLSKSKQKSEFQFAICKIEAKKYFCASIIAYEKTLWRII